MSSTNIVLTKVSIAESSSSGSKSMMDQIFWTGSQAGNKPQVSQIYLEEKTKVEQFELFIVKHPSQYADFLVPLWPAGLAIVVHTCSFLVHKH